MSRKTVREAGNRGIGCFFKKLDLSYCKQSGILFNGPVVSVFTVAICAYFFLSPLMFLGWSGRVRWLKIGHNADTQ